MMDLHMLFGNFSLKKINKDLTCSRFALIILALNKIGK